MLVVIMTGCGHQDPIDRIVKQASANPHFSDGMFHPLRLPETASPTQVVTRIEGKLPILEIRQVFIPDTDESRLFPEATSYTAVLMKFGDGRRVVLIKPSPGGWWSRVYNVPLN